MGTSLSLYLLDLGFKHSKSTYVQFELWSAIRNRVCQRGIALGYNLRDTLPAPKFAPPPVDPTTYDPVLTAHRAVHHQQRESMEALARRIINR